MRFGVVIPSYGRLAEPHAVRRLVLTAEELGYEGAWFADHVAIPAYATAWLPPPLLEPLACCLIGLGETTRLRFGTDVLVLPTRHPVPLAATLAAADRLSGGRLTIAVGVGYLEGELRGAGVSPRERGAVTDEYLAALRTLLEADGPVAFHGDRVAFDDLLPAATPAHGVPVWVGGNAPAALERAARLGDGWHPLWPTPEEYAAGRSRILARRTELGVGRRFTFSYSAPVGRVLERPRSDWSSDAAREPRRPARPEYGYARPRPRDHDGRPRFTGTPEQLAGDVASLAAAGVEHVVLRFWSSASTLDVRGVEAQLRRFATEVASDVA